MKNSLLLLLSAGLLLSSCATHKYGCGLSEVKPNINPDVKPTYVSGVNSKLPSTKYFYKYPSKVVPNPNISLCRGFGEVAVIDTYKHPYKYLLRLNGILMKDDGPTSVRYVIVDEGRFYNELTPFIGKQVYFECKAILPKQLTPDNDIQEIKEGCIDHIAKL